MLVSRVLATAVPLKDSPTAELHLHSRPSVDTIMHSSYCIVVTPIYFRLLSNGATATATARSPARKPSLHKYSAHAVNSRQTIARCCSTCTMVQLLQAAGRDTRATGADSNLDTLALRCPA